MAEPGLRPKEANAIVCRCPLTVTRFVQGENTGSKPLRDLKGYPVLQHCWRWVGGGVCGGGGSASPPFLCSYTHSDIHRRSHARLLPAINAPKSDSFMPTFLSGPRSFVSHRSTVAWPHGTSPQRSAAAAQAYFQALQPWRIQGPKARGSTSHICRDLTRKGIALRFFQEVFALWNSLKLNGCNQS